MIKAVQIKRADVVQDIRRLADLTGASLTDAVAKAVRSQLAIEQARVNAKLSKRRAEADRILSELRRLPVVGPMVSDADLYDDAGLPK
ncbi:MAG: type II toxin-antitoxin system VapB family antitoxin [Acidobacteria bacterium]|nr:type II toxin-antitoxin system VapB family antitoxin [Acidobacteriota bacterium]